MPWKDSFLNALIGPMIKAGLYLVSRSRLPRIRGTFQLKGVQAPVEILRDHWYVAHIYARSAADALFAQGFVHAQERLWQMDFMRRVTSGRLAEVLGEKALPNDKAMRILGMRRVAEGEVGEIPDPVRSLLDRYCAGANAWIETALAERKLPVEFTLLGYEPEPWQPADIAAWSKLMSWTLAGNWESEFLRSHIYQRLGPDKAAEMDLGIEKAWALILEAERALNGGQDIDPTRSMTGPQVSDGAGSNNWVVHGSRTTTGMPLLANDMHLGLTTPMIWFENHLVGGELDVTGVSFPGVPFVISGHTRNVAWGFTDGLADVQDLYEEHIRRSPEGSWEYEYQDSWLPADVHSEEIRVKGGQTVLQEVIVTRHGPIMNALFDHIFVDTPPYALRWVALEPEMNMLGFYGMNTAQTCLDFRQALRHFSGPSQNTVYADTDGNIAYTLTGKIPIRARGNGSIPVPGWTGEYEWTGYIPDEELPHQYNPPQGYAASANNPQHFPNYSHFLGQDYASSDRYLRIVELIEANPQVDVAYFKRMQYDQVSLSARILGRRLGELHLANLEREGALSRAPKEQAPGDDFGKDGDRADDETWQVEARRVLAPGGMTQFGVAPTGSTHHRSESFPADGELREIIGAMAGWDGNLKVDSPLAAVFEVTIRHAFRSLLEHHLTDLSAQVLGEGPASGWWGFHAWEWFIELLDSPDSHWFDLGNQERRDDVLLAALHSAVESLKMKQGPDWHRWSWGKLNRLTFAHMLGLQKPLDQVFNIGPYAIGGDGSTVWAAFSSLYDAGRAVITGPPFRFIADLGDLDHCWAVSAPGQSGHIASPHYRDGVKPWFTGQYHPVLFRRDEIELYLEARLVLEPG